MSSRVLDLFKLHHDPIHMGWTRRGMSFGTTLLNGLAWSIPDAVQGDESVAAVGLFRGRDRISAIDYDYCVGLSLGKGTSVSESAMFSRQADTWYAYDVRAINGAGVIGDPGGTAIRLHTDGTGKIEQDPARTPAGCRQGL